MNYTVYCDGAASFNGTENAVGGCAAIILLNNKKIWERSESLEAVTNQQMELLACILALEYLVSIIEDSDSVIIYTDSAYLCNCFQQKWYENWKANGWINSKKQPVANKDLWERILDLLSIARGHISFQKVKGHNGDIWNEYVDRLAVMQKKKLQLSLQKEQREALNTIKGRSDE